MKKQTGFRAALRFGIAGTSLAAFLAGWILLGHSDKPAALVGTSTGSAQGAGSAAGELAPLPTLAPLSELNNSPSTRLQPVPRQDFSFAQPRLRTRGS